MQKKKQRGLSIEPRLRHMLKKQDFIYHIKGNRGEWLGVLVTRKNKAASSEQ